MERFLIVFLLIFGFLYSDLERDLAMVQWVDEQVNDRLPVMYNYLLQGGYWNMPSARMGVEGEIGLGYAWVNPYIHYNLRVQFNPYIEISGDYRIYKGVDDPILTPLGFGDLADKGANLKLSLFRPEDSHYALPGIAFGIEDFIGTKGFYARYVVLTQVFLKQNLEISLGYGQKRIRRFFGGVAWTPLRRWNVPFFKNLCLVAEYDAIPYEDEEVEKHPKARRKKSPINFGVKTRLLGHFDLSLSYIRGHRLACSVSAFYNFGSCRGLIPKIDDPLPYCTPINWEPLGKNRPPDLLAQELSFPFYAQGFDLLEIWRSNDSLFLRVVNNNYLNAGIVRERLNALLGSLIPENIEEVMVLIEGDAFPIQQILFNMEAVRQFKAKQICEYELNTLNLTQNAVHPPCDAELLFKRRRNLWNLEVFPKTYTFFGSSRGKFKYALGLNVGMNGFLFDKIYYTTLIGWIGTSNLGHSLGIDRLNPSQLVNVRTDIVRYYEQKGITLDQAYLQRNWNLGKGWFSKVSLGYFEEEYGGIATEFLFYPVGSQWALGVDGAYLRKRTYSGLGFTDKFRKLSGTRLRWIHFTPTQGFVNLYYNWCDAEMTFKIKVGKFLANDWGARFELIRYFSSGLRLSAWYTYTNGKDHINGKTYHDKGVAFSMPLDIFFTYSERDRWGYGMSAWLRDVGVIAETGKGLYNMITEEREF